MTELTSGVGGGTGEQPTDETPPAPAPQPSGETGEQQTDEGGYTPPEPIPEPIPEIPVAETGEQPTDETIPLPPTILVPETGEQQVVETQSTIEQIQKEEQQNAAQTTTPGLDSTLLIKPEQTYIPEMIESKPSSLPIVEKEPDQVKPITIEKAYEYQKPIPSKELFENQQQVLYGDKWQERLKELYGKDIEPDALKGKDFDYALKNGYVNEAGIATEKGRAVGLPEVMVGQVNVTPELTVNNKAWAILTEDAKQLFKPEGYPVEYNLKDYSTNNIGKLLKANITVIDLFNKAKAEIKNNSVPSEDAIQMMYINNPWLSMKDYIAMNDYIELITQAKDNPDNPPKEIVIINDFLAKVNDQLKSLVTDGTRPEQSVLDYLGIKLKETPKGVLTKKVSEEVKKIEEPKPTTKKDKDLLTLLLDLLNKPVSAGEVFTNWEHIVKPKIDENGDMVNIQIVYWQGDDKRWYGMEADNQGKLLGFIVGSKADDVTNTSSQAWNRGKNINWEEVTKCTAGECKAENLEFKKAYEHIKQNGFPNDKYRPETTPSLILPDSEIPKDKYGIVVNDKTLTDQRYAHLYTYKGFTLIDEISTSADEKKALSGFQTIFSPNDDNYKVVIMSSPG